MEPLQRKDKETLKPREQLDLKIRTESVIDPLLVGQLLFVLC